MGLLGGLFNQFKKGLKRTQELVLAPMGRLLGLRRLDEAQLEELEDLLLQADLGVKAVDQLMARLRAELKGGADIDPKQVLKDELLRILHQSPATTLRRRRHPGRAAGGRQRRGQDHHPGQAGRPP